MSAAVTRLRELIARSRRVALFTGAGISTESGIPDFRAAGVPPERVIELHGNATYAACLDCRARHELEAIRAAFEADATLPVCTRCGRLVKAATISFGQALPAEALRRAEAETLACDLFLAVGSSLRVYPAAGFPALAESRGAALVIVNREPTPLDPIARLVLHAEIGPTLAAAVEP